MDTYNIDNSFLSEISHAEILMLLHNIQDIKLELSSHVIFETSVFSNDYKVKLNLKKVNEVKGIKVAGKLLTKWSKSSKEDRQHYEFCSDLNYKYDNYYYDCCVLCNFLYCFPSRTIDFAVNNRDLEIEDLEKAVGKWKIEYAYA